MENPGYVVLSRQKALGNAMNTIANNIANINTPGYQSEQMTFKEYIADPQGSKSPIKMVIDHGLWRDTSGGPLKPTGNALDVAIHGDGYFGVLTPSGEIQYTRAGNFTLDAEGQIVNANGYPIVDDGGGTITIPEDARDIKIQKNGMVSTEKGELSRLMVARFDDEQEMKKQGNGLLSGGTPIIVEEPDVKQGFLEGSNVRGVIEITKMIDVSRAYQGTQNMNQGEHERLSNMIRKLSQTS